MWRAVWHPRQADFQIIFVPGRVPLFAHIVRVISDLASKDIHAIKKCAGELLEERQDDESSTGQATMGQMLKIMHVFSVTQVYPDQRAVLP